MFIEVCDTCRAKTIIGIIYQPQNTDLSDFNNELENVIISLTSMNSSLIFVGDYNINFLNYEIHTETGNFFNVLFSNSIIPLITKPTRYGEHSATLIDNILTNKILDLIVSTSLVLYWKTS